MALEAHPHRVVVSVQPSSDRGQRIYVWCNPRAGRGRAGDLAERTRAVASERGHTVTLLHADSVSGYRSAIEEAVADGLDRLVVVGGDGTLHQAIQVAAGTPLIVGVVPAGSGNDLVGGLGLATEPAEAIDLALGPASAIDLLRIGDRYGVTVATLGFSVAVNRRADRLRWPRGQAKYTVATLLELVGLRRYPITIELDGRRLEVSPNLVAFANTAIFGGGMRVAPDAEADDGQLDLVVVGPATRAMLLRVLPRVRTGGHVEHPAVTVHRGVHAVIEADDTWEIRADGEIVGSTPTVIELVPAALQLAGHRPAG